MAGEVPTEGVHDHTTNVGSFGWITRFTPPCPVSPIKRAWAPKILSLRPDGALDNRIMVKVSVEILGGPRCDQTCFFYGRNSVEDVCSAVIAYLRNNGNLPLEQLSSAVFSTQEETPVIIPAGSLLADLYETNAHKDGVCLELNCKIVDYNPRHRYIICPHEAPVPVPAPVTNNVLTQVVREAAETKSSTCGGASSSEIRVVDLKGESSQLAGIAIGGDSGYNQASVAKGKGTIDGSPSTSRKEKGPLDEDEAPPNA